MREGVRVAHEGVEAMHKVILGLPWMKFKSPLQFLLIVFTFSAF